MTLLEWSAGHSVLLVVRSEAVRRASFSSVPRVSPVASLAAYSLASLMLAARHVRPHTADLPD